MRKKQALIIRVMNTKTVVVHRNGLSWGPYGPPLMRRGLGWALEVGPIYGLCGSLLLTVGHAFYCLRRLDTMIMPSYIITITFR